MPSPLPLATAEIHPALFDLGRISADWRRPIQPCHQPLWRRAASYGRLSAPVQRIVLEDGAARGAGADVNGATPGSGYRMSDLDEWAAKRRATTTAEADRLACA